MWLRRLVAVSLSVSLMSLNALVIIGLLSPDKSTAGQSAQTAQAPVVTLTVEPASIAANTTANLTWTSTNDATGCVASDKWSGEKTPFGSESTGKITAPGSYTYTITCKNAAGSGSASATLSVGNAAAPTKSTSTTTGGGSGGKIYCGGRTPCYGPKDVAAHSTSGNCWGYNLDRVINISGFNTYHQSRSGISTIAISAVCGHNLAPALSGQVSAEGQVRSHSSGAKQNSDRNVIPYFVGYYDATKP